jgi:hypothetical protein
MLMVAGSDTTSTALASTTHYLVKNSQSLAEATKEVRNTFKDLNEIVHGPALSSCVYLRTCIDEGDPPPINWSEKFANGFRLEALPASSRVSPTENHTRRDDY